MKAFRSVFMQRCQSAMVLALLGFGLAGCNFPNRDLQPTDQINGPAPASTGTSATPAATSSAPAAATQPMPYSLVPGDEISVKVVGLTDLNVDLKLDSDGTIQYPYVGQMKLEGLTTNDVRRKITAGLKDYYTDPQVVVNLVSQEQPVVRVLGEVNSPGLIEIKQDMRITDAIALAKGMTLDAAQRRVILVRRVSDKEIRAGYFNYRQATLDPTSDAWAQDITLRKGDTIIVPRNGRAQFETAFKFISTMFGSIDDIERSIILYPDVRDVLNTGDRGGKTTVIIR